MKQILSFMMAWVMVCASLAFLCGCAEITSDLPDGSGGQQTEQPAQEVSVKLMSINIAGQDMTEPDYISTIRYPGQTGKDYTYAHRRKRLDAIVSAYSPDVLMLQEVNGESWWWRHLVSDENSFLNTFEEYALVGTVNRIGQTDGAGDHWYDLYNQLYYNKNKFEPIKTGMFYLNEKRTEPFSEEWHESAYYDSDDNATCVWAVLKDKKTGICAVYASTHLKTAPYLARAITNYNQAVELADGLYEISCAYAQDGTSLPVVVAGDFNMSTDQNYNKTYSYMTENAAYKDLRTVAASSDTKGTARVWGQNKTAIRNDGCTSDGYRIDYFFAQSVRTEKYSCLNGMFMEDSGGEVFYIEQPVFDGSAYDLSDHLPIYAEVKIPRLGETAAPSDPYRNTAGEQDTTVTDGGSSELSQTKIVFSASDLLKYFSGSFMEAKIVKRSDGIALRLTATRACANVYVVFDYAQLMKDKGLSPVRSDIYNKINIRFAASLTVGGSELMMAALSEGDEGIAYGVNTTVLPAVQGNVLQTQVKIKKSEDCSGNFVKIAIGTMAYMNDYSGVCGMYAGDSIYIYSLEWMV